MGVPVLLLTGWSSHVAIGPLKDPEHRHGADQVRRRHRYGLVGADWPHSPTRSHRVGTKCPPSLIGFIEGMMNSLPPYTTTVQLPCPCSKVLGGLVRHASRRPWRVGQHRCRPAMRLVPAVPCSVRAADCIFSITWSRLKLAAFMRGGNSLKVSRNSPRMPAPAPAGRRDPASSRSRCWK